MSRGIQQVELNAPVLEGDRGRPNGDAPPPFQRQGVGHGVAVVHTACLPNDAAGMQQRLGYGGLARIHVGEDS